MLRETSQEKALRIALSGPREKCRRIEERIRRAHLRTGHDPDGREPRLERLVAHIRQHLVEPSLSVAGACEAVGIGDRSIGGELRAYAGYTVDELIDRLRIDAAVKLVVETDISLGDISHLLGFKAYRTFTGTYKSLVGEPPRKTRQHCHEGGGPDDLPLDLPFDFHDFRAVRRLGDGESTPNELERLGKTLGELYPDSFGDREPEPQETAAAAILPPVFDAEGFERVLAEHEIWPTLLRLPFVEQRRYVCQCRFWTSALFDFLHRKSRAEGRRDRQRGIELAQLVLDSLDGSEDLLGERVHSLRAQGWAWLCNARRLALEFFAADSASKHAEAMLQIRECRSDPFAHGIVYICKGTLRMFQRRHQEAIDLFDLALDFFEKANDVSWQLRTLLHRASAFGYADRYEEMALALERAETLPKADVDETSAFWIDHTKVTGLVRAGDFVHAEVHLESLIKKVHRIERQLWRFQVQWLDAFIDHGMNRIEAAEAKYLSAQSCVETLDESLYLALVSLDLAVLYAETGQVAKLAQTAAATLPVFSSIQLYDEPLAALRLLDDADKVTRDLLLDLRSALWRDPLVALRQKRESEREP